MSASRIFLSLVVPLFVEVEPSTDDAAREKLAARRGYYAETAARNEFFRDADRKEALKLAVKPVMA